jgi:hypothetical protein
MGKSAMLAALRDFLRRLPAGPIADPRDLVSHLVPCWEQFHGSSSEGTEAYKLSRIEDVMWDPPCLSFTIERHGGTVMGSRAALHKWTVDIDGQKASCEPSFSYRQIRKRQPPLLVEPLADDVAQKIISGAAAPELSWKSDSLVRVLIQTVIPAGPGVPQQTLRGRRKRFRTALEVQLQQGGWEAVGPNTYAKRQSG